MPREESAEIKRLKAESRRLTEDLEMMRRALIFFASSHGGNRVDVAVIAWTDPGNVNRRMWR